METDYFKVPHNKHLGKKPKDWPVPKYSEGKYKKICQMEESNIKPYKEEKK